ncbi:hypothetical protein ES319_A13G178900v1 [Gossypium barbadense]|uniref:Uncharacterized protein n=3 Tax=Gossypium TaxID=3633 RepID=A0A5J5T0W4_GOSBA|nr:hypothetical protein ES319_A13G178900v1 [Gossypium barbadense]
MEQSNKCLSFEPLENRETMRTAGCDGKNEIWGVEEKGLTLNLDGEEDESNKNSSTVSGCKSGNTKLCSRGHWRPAEDAKLMELVTYYGPQNWNLIAEHLEGRSGKSCRLRWFNQLDPRINKRNFTEEEEEMLLVAHRLHGNKWARIARLFDGRTDNAVKNHWHVITARKHREKSGVYKRKKPPSYACRALPKGLGLTIVNSACSASDQSTISSNIDQSAKVSSPVHQMDVSRRCSLFENVATRGIGYVVYQQGLMEAVMSVNRSATSLDSNSEVSAAESVGTNWTSHFISGESCGNGNEKIPFIDFLGVGRAS